jgi:AAA family ATP:ADP antiporter
VSIAGFAWLGLAPSLAALVVFVVARRACGFALSRPVREALYTVVGREERYKAKAFIDTVVYRGGDAFSAWGVGVLRAAGLSFAAVSLAVLPVGAAWLGLAFYLGARMRAWTRADAHSSAPSPASR